MSNGSEAIFMPTMSVYDTNMMTAYINAVKGEYERSLEDYDKFVSKYGDFTSPILKDVEYWNDNTFGQFDRTYDELVAAGIDPLRTKEGQAIMRRAARNIPYAELAKRKQNAKDAEKYNEVVRQLKLQNKFDEEFADWQFRRTHGGVSMRNWDSSMGMFGAETPSPYQSMQEATKSWYEGLQNGYLGTQNGYDYFGKSPDAVRAVIAAQAPNLTSEYWQYLKDRIRSVLGPNASEEAVNSALQSVLFDSARNVYSVQDPTTGEWSNATRKENDEYERQRKFYYDDRLDAVKTLRDRDTKLIENGADTDGDGVLSKEERKNYAESKKVNTKQKNSKLPGGGFDIYGDVFSDGISKAVLNTVRPDVTSDPDGMDYLSRNIATSAFKFGNDFTKEHPKATQGDVVKAFYERYRNQESLTPDDFNNYFLDHDDGFSSSGIATDADVKRLTTKAKMISNTLGCRYSKLDLSNEKDTRQRLEEARKDGKSIVMTYTDGDTYTSPQKDGTVRQYTKVKVYSKKEDGTREVIGEMFYELERSVTNSYDTDNNGKRVYPKSWNTAPDPNFRGRQSAKAMAERSTYGTSAKDVNEEIRISSH